MGHDNQWIFPAQGEGRVARFQDLIPGTYTFKVTACNSEGTWNPSGASMTFTLKPFFYQTILFKVIVLILIASGLGTGFYFYRKHTAQKKIKYKNSPLNPEFAEECIAKLKRLMEIEKVYVDPDISLNSLAEKMTIAPHQLSQLLNDRLNRNFSEYINGYRIDEAKRILKSSKGAQQKIDALAFDVGFSTTVVFYRAFKKYTGMTPTGFRKEFGKEK